MQLFKAISASAFIVPLYGSLPPSVSRHTGSPLCRGGDRGVFAPQHSTIVTKQTGFRLSSHVNNWLDEMQCDGLTGGVCELVDGVRKRRQSKEVAFPVTAWCFTSIFFFLTVKTWQDWPQTQRQHTV